MNRFASSFDELLALVDRLAARLPQVPRLRILDVVEAEWVRLGASAEPYLAHLVGAAALSRLRADPWAV
ncbi:hypothetical protein [Amnibacterium kyonggiense]|uniref:Uncharacterized protein n=1 Tax=Amnibacterium kyonggiense TaxID=595671 RepID=A0A4R7FS25_9MICO|nr:hypothetical protein [Amnibacterium kyonggiense]TDS80623.1 hypothetical protein CLV52_1189 [Amnibacterium kyonggiense]